MQPRQSFVEEEPTEQNIRKGIEIIAKARGEDVPIDHREDVQQPVEADQRRGRKQQEQSAAAPEGLPDVAPAAHDQQQQREEGQRPQHPVGDDLDRANVADGLEVDRQHAP